MQFRGTQFPGGKRDSFDPQPGVQKQPSFAKSTSSALDQIASMIPSDNPYVIKFEKFTKQVDELIDNHLGPAKPYVPFIGRFFIVATFFEDSLRIMSQWKEQVYYLATYRHLYEWFVRVFLFVNIISMLAGAVLVVLRKKPEIATGLLSSIVLLQGFVYGLFFEPIFFLRNVSVIGGLLLALSDSLVVDKRSLLMPGLPLMESKDNKKYFLLVGRILLIVLFLAFTMTVKWNLFTFLVIVVGIVSCLSIVVGYKTKFSASILTLLLTVFNITTNHYWTYGYKDTRRDYLRYEFFQTLSIVGGLLLIVDTGAGELSVVFLGSLIGPHTPVSLGGGVGSVWLPRLVKGLKDVGVNTPSSHSTDSLFPELLGVVNRWLSRFVVVSLGRPSGLTNPEVNVGRTLGGLDGLQSLHDVIEERKRSVVHGLSLPVREGIGVDNVGGLDDIGVSTVNKNVPRVNSSDRNVAVRVTVLVLDSGQELLDLGNVVGQLGGSQVTSVKSFRSNGEGLDGALRDVWQIRRKSLLLSSESGVWSWPDTQGDGETFVFGNRSQNLQSVTRCNSVSLDGLSLTGQSVQIGLVIRGGLTRAVVGLDSQVETQL
ncbi:hypothetical protein OGAPHI_000440 [Ogataea philodendri]|uniref:Uncharacterized protein n=1 Tax=Ogataea philodendri TaxID=1378263 RepID=A0A9P8TAW1_9ASCO|nr:uncharacterized protein OGAPHI_000440 [Ogataea philodendri]KAH3671735.1 hypothetical protein OGAPHI_000440 [Ogataea philodendri]